MSINAIIEKINKKNNDSAKNDSLKEILDLVIEKITIAHIEKLLSSYQTDSHRVDGLTIIINNEHCHFIPSDVSKILSIWQTDSHREDALQRIISNNRFNEITFSDMINILSQFTSAGYKSNSVKYLIGLLQKINSDELIQLLKITGGGGLEIIKKLYGKINKFNDKIEFSKKLETCFKTVDEYETACTLLNVQKSEIIIDEINDKNSVYIIDGITYDRRKLKFGDIQEFKYGNDKISTLVQIKRNNDNDNSLNVSIVQQMGDWTMNNQKYNVTGFLEMRGGSIYLAGGSVIGC